MADVMTPISTALAALRKYLGSGFYHNHPLPLDMVMDGPVKALVDAAYAAGRESVPPPGDKLAAQIAFDDNGGTHENSEMWADGEGSVVF